MGVTKSVLQYLLLTRDPGSAVMSPVPLRCGGPTRSLPARTPLLFYLRSLCFLSVGGTEVRQYRQYTAQCSAVCRQSQNLIPGLPHPWPCRHATTGLRDCSVGVGWLGGTGLSFVVSRVCQQSGFNNSILTDRPGGPGRLQLAEKSVGY